MNIAYSRCLSVVVYNRVWRTNEDLYLGALFIISFCHILNSGLVTPTTEMETKRHGFKMPNLASTIICRDSSWSKFLGTDGHLVHAAIPASRGVRVRGIIS
ncbi:hypothetical protein IFM89_020411 [Coptis chinensis]|uniref:Uncharacterized protein n=1 Tax=Coptis chinensis TaxID=261450 RepID=A0A835HEF2_9MAGN|nr:hypothetical protein IFM89_020411 [Coptis chinensis]